MFEKRNAPLKDVMVFSKVRYERFVRSFFFVEYQRHINSQTKKMQPDRQRREKKPFLSNVWSLADGAMRRISRELKSLSASVTLRRPFFS